MIQSSYIVVTGHDAADWDCIASMYAVTRLDSSIIPIIPSISSLSIKRFLSDNCNTLCLHNFNPQHQISVAIDQVTCLVIVDTKRYSRLPHVHSLLNQNSSCRNIIVYDHHPSHDDDNLQHINEDYTDATVGACSTLLCEIIEQRKIAISSFDATMLGLGIYGDTGCLTFDNTSTRDVLAVAFLLKNGLDLSVIREYISSTSHNHETLLILKEMNETCVVHHLHGLDIGIIPLKFSDYKPGLAAVVEEFLTIEKLHAVIAVASMKNNIVIIGRSSSSRVNVSKLCENFGGGGHPGAASATLHDRDVTLTDAIENVYTLLVSFLYNELKVVNYMNRNVLTVSSNDNLMTIYNYMTSFHLKCAPVVSSDTNKIIGIVDKRFIDNALRHNLGNEILFSYVKDSVFHYVNSNDDIYKVLSTVMSKGQRLAPVIDDGNCVGVITKTDIINLFFNNPGLQITDRFYNNELNAQKLNVKNRISSLSGHRVVEILSIAGEIGKELNIKVYVVGGYVRDLFLNRKNIDIDIAIECDKNNNPDNIYGKTLLQRLGGGKLKEHAKFHTVTLILASDGFHVDISTTRLEYYETPGALPCVSKSSLKMDLSRRDFTINALAIELNTMLLIDYFDGYNDIIKYKTINILHGLSIVEDCSRILRAIRFEQRFHFTIGKQTLYLINKAIEQGYFKNLNLARLFHEFYLLLMEDDECSFNCLCRCEELQIYNAIFENWSFNLKIKKAYKNIEKIIHWYDATANATVNNQNVECWILKLCSLFPANINDAMTIVSKIGCDIGKHNKIMLILNSVPNIERDISTKVRNNFVCRSQVYDCLKNYSIESLLYTMGITHCHHTKDSIHLYISALSQITLDISGNDIKDYLKPGPMYSKLLLKVLYAKIDGQISGRDEQLEYLKVILGDLSILETR